MKTRVPAHFAVRIAGLLAAAAILPLQAAEIVLSFDSADYARGNLRFAHSPEPMRSSMRSLLPFARATPGGGYTGPDFFVGYEVRSDAPANLAVSDEILLVEDNVPNGPAKFNDAISIVPVVEWAGNRSFSVAALVVFPTKPFSLSALSYSASNWTRNRSYTEKLRHRWVVVAGGRYYVNVGFLGRTGRSDNALPFDVIRTERSFNLVDAWVEVRPGESIFANLEGQAAPLGKALDSVTGVGFYMDSLGFQGAAQQNRQWQLRLLTFTAEGSPVPGGAGSSAASR
jgi:hypothetical protein